MQIKQAKTQTEFMGQPVRRLPQTSTGFPIPYVLGKGWQHGLNEDEVKIVEEAYGHSFSNKEHDSYWKSIRFILDHEIDSIEEGNPLDLLKLRILQNRGQIISSLKDDGTAIPDFVLHNEEEETKVTASLYKRRDKAIVQLNKVAKSPLYIVAISNYLLPSSMWTTSEDTAYIRLRDYVEGVKPFDTNKGKNVDTFLATIELDKDFLYVSVDVKEAIKRNIIRKVGNSFKNILSDITYGRNKEEVITFLMNPANQDELGANSKNDLATSIRQQIKNKR